MRALLRAAALVVVALAAVASLRDGARAQACCSGGGALTPWRLEHHERALVGLITRVSPGLGAFDDSGAYHATPAGVRELEAEARLMASLRLHERVQLGLQLPLVLEHRVAGGVDATGGGLGDVSLAARWDPLLAGELDGAPGLALELGVIAPSGTAPEDADEPLAVDATGVGAWQLVAIGALEHVFGADRQWLVSLRGGVRWRAPRTAAGRDVDASTEGHVSLGGVVVLTSLSLAGSLDFTWRGGDPVLGRSTDERLLGVGLALGVPLAEGWRALASVRLPLPIDHLGVNRPVALDLGLTLAFAGF